MFYVVVHLNFASSIYLYRSVRVYFCVCMCGGGGGGIHIAVLYERFIGTVFSQGHNFYKLKYISLEEVKIVPFQQ